ncbi:MAG: Ig-like domain-containing protein, partial [Patescibacteria group bacterium]
MNTSKKISGFRKRLLGFKTTFVFMALVVLFFGAALPVLALDTGVQYGTASGLGTQDLRITIMKIIRIFLGFVGVIAIVINVYAGYLWMASAGNAEQIDKAKRILRNAAIGLVIIFSAFGIVSFIISALEGATNVGQTPGGGPPAGACDNCGHLGNGIIESVYPIPFAKNVARNTSIMVTFKVAMKPETIVKGCTALPCADKELVSNNVRIYENNKPEASRLGDGDVLASSTDGKTFVFKPKNYLGDGTNSIWYAVKLTSGIQKGNGESAFPGAAGYFTWRFEVGTFLDLDPVEAGNVFPEPDNQADNYTTAAAGQAAGKIKVLAANFPPRVNQTASVAVVKLGGTTADAASTGTYNSDFSGQIKVTVNSSSLTANVFWAINNPNNKTNAPITSDNINLGGGLTLRLGSGYAAGNQWGVNVIPNQSADTLAVDNKLYTFALTPPALTANQIERGVDAADQAQKIAAKINADNLSVTATATGAEVSLQAKMAGKTGNIISLSASGNWASLCNIDATPVCDASRITLSGG